MRKRGWVRLVVGLAVVAALVPESAAGAERPVAWSILAEGVPRNGATVQRVSVVVDDCGTNAGEQRVDVRRTAEAVTITVFDAVPDAEICPAIAKQVDLDVDLGGRLGRRAIVDGADGATRVSAEVAAPWRSEDQTRQAGQRRLRISFARLCGPSVQGYTRFVVRRKRRAIVLTVLQRRRDPPAYPSPCGRTTIKAPLGGRLGRRGVRDGA